MIQTRIPHRFDVVPRAVKDTSVPQLINLRVIKHRGRDIPLTICYLNARSVKNKALSVVDFVISQDIDMLIINQLVSSGYTIQHISRPSEKRGGGVVVLYKCGLAIKTLDSTRNGMFTHFEHNLWTVQVVSNDVNVILCILYRPPPSKRNGFKNIVFFDEWSLYLDQLAFITNDVIITGDLNFHLDNVNDVDAVRFNGTLEAHGLVKLGPTDNKGHTLDVVITRDISSLLIGMPTVSEPCLGDTKGNPSGDHLAVCFIINLTKPDSVRQPVTFRKLRDICIPEFIKYLTPILNTLIGR